MFSTPGIAALILLIYIKPQEFIPGLEGMPLLYVFLGLAVFGLVLDLRLAHAKFDPPPHWPYVALFVPWCYATYLAKAGTSGFPLAAIDLLIVVVLFFVLAIGVQSFRSFETIMASVLGASMFVAFVCFHQGFAPLGCAVQEGGELETLRPDGRPCEREEECYLGDAEPGAVYQCERQGLFGTVSVGRGRVRYRGVLKDPNEISLAIGAAMPMLVARVQRKPSLFRYLSLIVSVVVIAVTIVMTQSRGGTLVFLAVVAVYFVKRFGVKGAIAGAMLAAPLLLLGGRSGAEAKDSADERTDALVAGIQMVQTNPFAGVGFQQYTEHHNITAHNSYMLAVAELGIPGLFLFLAMVYLSFKICYVAARDYQRHADAKIAATWGTAMLAALAGVAIGSFFLSFTYHQVLWIYLGLSGALYGVIRKHDPKFKVSLGLTEKVLVLIAAGAFPVAMKVALRLKGH
ncbi:MAG TPA: O-antigen ligase family protein [Polyangiaceae bacterium]|jgi:O-antigen ligase|nr:O-antigen ligase family protein [Polyangiaceae bacterium]